MRYSARLRNRYARLYLHYMRFSQESFNINVPVSEVFDPLPLQYENIRLLLLKIFVTTEHLRARDREGSTWREKRLRIIETFLKRLTDHKDVIKCDGNTHWRVHVYALPVAQMKKVKQTRPPHVIDYEDNQVNMNFEHKRTSLTHPSSGHGSSSLT